MTDLPDMPNLTVSWSSLKRYEECNHLQLRTMQGKTKGVVDGRVFLPGTIADRIMRAWLESDDPQPGEMAGMIEEMFRKYTKPETEEEKLEAQYVIKWRGNASEDRKSVKDFVRETVNRLEPFLVEHVLPYGYHPELRFKSTIGIPFLDGRMTSIDLIGGIDIAVQTEPPSEAHHAGRFKLYDLKATKDPGYISKTLGQGTFYDIAFGNLIGDTAQPEAFGFVAPMTDERIFWSSITDDDRVVMMTRIINFAHGNWRKEYQPKVDDVGCNYCVAYHSCDKFMLDMKKDSMGRNRISLQDTMDKRRAMGRKAPQATQTEEVV